MIYDVSNGADPRATIDQRLVDVAKTPWYLNAGLLSGGALGAVLVDSDITVGSVKD